MAFNPEQYINHNDTSYDRELLKYRNNFGFSKGLLIESNRKMKLIVENTIKEQEELLNKEILKYKDLMTDITYYMKDRQLQSLNQNTFKIMEEEIKTRIQEKIMIDPRFEASIQKSFEKIRNTKINITKHFESYVFKKRKRIRN